MVSQILSSLAEILDWEILAIHSSWLDFYPSLTPSDDSRSKVSDVVEGTVGVE